MANPYTAGTERNKLFAYASSKGNSDKSSQLFAEFNAGKGLFDVSGGTAVAKAGLATHSGVARGSVATR